MTEEKGELKKRCFSAQAEPMCVCVFWGDLGDVQQSWSLHQNVTYVSNKCVWKWFGTLPLPHDPRNPDFPAPPNSESRITNKL